MMLDFSLKRELPAAACVQRAKPPYHLLLRLVQSVLLVASPLKAPLSASRAMQAFTPFKEQVAVRFVLRVSIREALPRHVRAVQRVGTVWKGVRSALYVTRVPFPKPGHLSARNASVEPFRMKQARRCVILAMMVFTATLVARLAKIAHQRDGYWTRPASLTTIVSQSTMCFYQH